MCSSAGSEPARFFHPPLMAEMPPLMARPPTDARPTDTTPVPAGNGAPPAAVPAGLETAVSPSVRRRVRRRRALRRAGALGLELLVVFAGVYAAFLLGAYQERQRDDDRRQAIYRALLSEVDRMDRLVDDQRRVLRDVWIEPMVEPYERGERPFVYGVWLPSGHLGETADGLVESGVGLLDPALVQQVGTHRALVQFMLDQSARALRLSDEQITPRMEAQDFYDPESGRLRPQHRWYVVLPEYLMDNADRAAASGDSLRAEIERRLADG